MVAQSQPPTRDSLRNEDFQPEQILPAWARSSNPIVRRHLGMYWRTLPPQLTPIARILAFWAVALVVGIFFPVVMYLLMTVTIAAILVIPVVIAYYGYLLFRIGVAATEAMQREQSNNTLTLLRATPMSLQQIFLGKIAAAIWKQMDDLMLVVMAGAIFGVPLVTMTYSDVWSPELQPGLAQLMFVIGTASSLLRLLVEPLFIGALGIAIGTAIPYRSTAITSTLGIAAFYFLFINMLRGVPQVTSAPLLILLVDFVLPVVLPLLGMALALWLASVLVTSD